MTAAPSAPPGPRCPRCQRQITRRCPRSGTLERILSAIYVYPFRCQICTRRFRALRWGTRYFRSTIDRREYERAAVHIPITFTIRGEQAQGELTDISLGGCALQTEFPLVPGETVRMELNLPRQTTPIVIDAAAVRSASDGRVGLSFDRIARDHRRRLHEVMLGLLGYAPHTSPGGSVSRAAGLKRRFTLDAFLVTVVVIIVAMGLAILVPMMSFCVWGVNC
ncbi:MAG TPA: PilZ domain-containing protein [Methylomirabilota bacterium]|nr:PilZ domain-containing protein [Methylomirabilota bacterium]